MLQSLTIRIAPNVYAFLYKVNDVNIVHAQVSNLEVSFK